MKALRKFIVMLAMDWDGYKLLKNEEVAAKDHESAALKVFNEYLGARGSFTTTLNQIKDDQKALVKTYRTSSGYRIEVIGIVKWGKRS